MALPKPQSNKATYSLTLDCPPDLVPDFLRPLRAPIPFMGPPPPPPPPPPPFQTGVPALPPPMSKIVLPAKALELRIKETKLQDRRGTFDVVTKKGKMHVRMCEALWAWLKRPPTLKSEGEADDEDDGSGGKKKSVKMDVCAQALFRARRAEDLPDGVVAEYLAAMKEAAGAFLRSEEAGVTLPETWCAVKLVACVGEEVLVHTEEDEDVTGKLVEFGMNNNSYTVFIQRGERLEPPVVPLEVPYEEWHCGKGGVCLATQEIKWRKSDVSTKFSRKRSGWNNFSRGDCGSSATYDSDFD